MSDIREAPANSKLYHPYLSSAEVLDLVGLANAAYNDFYDNSVSGWSAITRELEIDPSFLPGSQDAFFVESDSVFGFFRADAQATVYRREDEPVIAIAFRGTESPLTDSEDWADIGNHADEFAPLLAAVDAYVVKNGITEIQITGHSLGGGVAEIIMERRPDTSTVSYKAVAIASPLASNTKDARVLNVGHEGDAVYSVVGFRNDNAVENLFAVFRDQGLLDVGMTEPFFAQHSIDAYENTVETVLLSQFQSETNRDSLVIVNYTDQPDDLENAVNDLTTPPDWPTPPYQALILGRNTAITDFKDDTRTLSADDWLIGGNADDWLEGFGGDDTLQGDVGSTLRSGGNDTMAGGAGKDLFLGTPEDLNGDTIVDLEIGDRIGVSGATVEEKTLQNEKGGDTTITFNADKGLLDIGGTDILINAVIPKGAGLRLSEEALDGGGSIIEVVPVDGQDIAFVIDTTGSMIDDIDSVKLQATSIIDAIFDPDRGLVNSRVAVVGYNDPETSTILSFTNQPDLADRRAAALNAISGISVIGGGDIPELTYSGLLRVLDGRAGEWREDALARKIILFGDAPAKDRELAPQVYALARNLGAAIDDRTDADVASNAFSMVTLSESVSMTTFATFETNTATGAITPVPVQIFTVAIGSDAGAISEFEEIASETGGEDFRVADASGVVETLLEIINLPIYSIFTPSIRVVEGDTGTTTVELTIRRDLAGPATVVTLALSGSSDTEDRALAFGTVSFAAGETERSVQLLVSGDTAAEDDETVIVSIESVSESATIGVQTATVTITNDDSAGTLDLESDLLAALTGRLDNAAAERVLDVFSAYFGSSGVGGQLRQVVASNANDIVIDSSSVDGVAVALIDTRSFPGVAAVVDNVDFLVALGEVNITGGTGDNVAIGDHADQNIVLGPGNDILFGGPGNDILVSTSGNDLLSGDDDNDLLGGGVGLDTLFGGTGADTLFGQDGEDWLVAGAGDDALAGGAETDRLFGEDGNDILFAEGGVDWLIGGAGNDIMAGGTEADSLFGGAGGDQLFGEAGPDWLLGGSGNDTVVGGGDDDHLYGEDGDDQLFAVSGSNWLLGGSGNDTLMGGSGNDRLFAETGDDVLFAVGGGADTLFGGAGADIFAIGPSGGTHWVGDFEIGVDRLAFTGNESLMAIQTSATRIGAGIQLTLADQSKVILGGIATLPNSAWF